MRQHNKARHAEQGMGPNSSTPPAAPAIGNVLLSRKRHDGAHASRRKQTHCVAEKLTARLDHTSNPKSPAAHGISSEEAQT